VCTILLAWRCPGVAPVVLVANRDELVARPSAPPTELNPRPRILGGRDLLAGGTWLAVAEDGRAAAVTNRRAGDQDVVTRDPDRRSRGEIPLALLSGADETELRDALTRLGPSVYNPVNVLYVSPRIALVAHIDDTGPPQIHTLQPGLHVLTVFDLDDAERPKVAALRRGFDAARAAAGNTGDLVAAMIKLISSNQTPTGDPLDAPCIHGDVYGTVSSSTVVIDADSLEYMHAPGRPCVTPFDRVLAAPTSWSSPT
jgi:uncharacterized protein with NRDE domain